MNKDRQYNSQNNKNKKTKQNATCTQKTKDSATQMVYTLKNSGELLCSGGFYASFMADKHNIKVELNCLQYFQQTVGVIFWCNSLGMY